MIENPLLDTIKTGAEKLGITPGAVRMLLFRHGLPHVKIGGRVYLELGEVRAWIAAHRVTSTKGPGVAGRMRRID